ncbi:MAG: MGMT family protein [Oligoflexia bacterium]|nr:MGMT family protein [Oligoflexia bacterium]
MKQLREGSRAGVSKFEKRSLSPKNVVAGTFAERCYNLLRTVPRGMITTYAELAHALGTRAYRAVGSAMNKNPYAPKVPCHRVVNSDGRLGGYAHGAKAKEKILKSEGIQVRGGKIVGFEKHLFRL